MLNNNPSVSCKQPSGRGHVVSNHREQFRHPVKHFSPFVTGKLVVVWVFKQDLEGFSPWKEPA